MSEQMRALALMLTAALLGGVLWGSFQIQQQSIAMTQACFAQCHGSALTDVVQGGCTPTRCFCIEQGKP
jgi:uncharacterized protein HemX